ncbi:MAG: tripartite tricarboxylate transporter TctB family protein [Thermodesulfobacteriota bacterium]
MKKDELIANAGVVAFFVFMLVQASELKFVRRFGDMGSGFWPIIILSTAIFLSLLVLIINTRKYLQEKKAGAPQEPAISSGEARERRMKLVLSVICLLVYILIMPYIGFVLATLLYVPAFILALGERRKWVLAVSPFLVTAMAVAVFGRFIAMPLPRGVEAFAAFSRIFY